MANLALSQVTAAQNQKEVTINDAFSQLDVALTDKLDVDFTAGNVSLTNLEFRRNIIFFATNMASGRTLTVPAIKRLFAVQNPHATHDLDVIRGSTTITVPAETAAVLYSDGTTNGLITVSAPPAAEASLYDFGMLAFATPTTDAVLQKIVMSRAITVPGNFAGARGNVDVDPTATFDIDFTVNGASAGTISISTAGAFTFTTPAGAPIALVAGNVVRFVAPTTVDDTVTGIAITIAATVT